MALVISDIKRYYTTELYLSLWFMHLRFTYSSPKRMEKISSLIIMLLFSTLSSLLYLKYARIECGWNDFVFCDWNHTLFNVTYTTFHVLLSWEIVEKFFIFSTERELLILPFFFQPIVSCNSLQTSTLNTYMFCKVRFWLSQHTFHLHYMVYSDLFVISSHEDIANTSIIYLLQENVILILPKIH